MSDKKLTTDQRLENIEANIAKITETMSFEKRLATLERAVENAEAACVSLIEKYTKLRDATAADFTIANNNHSSLKIKISQQSAKIELLEAELKELDNRVERNEKARKKYNTLLNSDKWWKRL